jgi:two-component system chemotaxis response regulator CheB
MRDIVVIGGSAGALPVLEQIVPQLPEGLPAAVFVVVHMAPTGLGNLDYVLGRKSSLRVSNARDGEPITPGRVYCGPPDRHLLLERNQVRLTRGPKENRSRPAVDPLFRSAAFGHGRRVIGVVLSGMLDDGTAGLWSIKDRGGVTVVQEPSNALQPSMPATALANVEIDHVATADEIGALICRLVREPVREATVNPVPAELELEQAISIESGRMAIETLDLGTLSPYTCPECRGVLTQLKSGGIPRFRCHTGHAYSASSLLESLSESVENNLWGSVRVMEERMLLLRHLASHLYQRGNRTAGDAAVAEAESEQRRLSAIRELTVTTHHEPHLEPLAPAPEPLHAGSHNGG